MPTSQPRSWTDIEAAYGFKIPASAREAVDGLGGSGTWYGDTYIEWHDLEAILGLREFLERFPGFLPIASDGSREHIGIDLQANPSPVVMVDITAASWTDAHLQSDDVSAWLSGLNDTPALRFDVPYRRQQ